MFNTVSECAIWQRFVVRCIAIGLVLVEVGFGLYVISHDTIVPSNCRSSWQFCVVATIYFGVAALFGVADLFVRLRPYKLIWAFYYSIGYTTVAIFGMIVSWHEMCIEQTSSDSTRIINVAVLADFLSLAMLVTSPFFLVLGWYWFIVWRKRPNQMAVVLCSGVELV